MLSCKEVSKLVSRAQDRSLSMRERIAVRMHLFMCTLCRRYKKQLDFLTRAGRGFLHASHGEEYALPETAKTRMKQVLEEAARQQTPGINKSQGSSDY